MNEPEPQSRLARVLDVRAATVIGLGAMLGTGVFAVWTPAYARAGVWLPLALAIVALVAWCNALSTARLAAVHPHSGGAYLYGRERLGRPAGVLAGYCFVIGKSASAGAAALTIGAYLTSDPLGQRLIGVIAVAGALALDLRGVVRSTQATRVFVVAVIAVVAVLVVAVLWSAAGSTPLPISARDLAPSFSVLGVLGAAGLLFVAFAGYARIATLGEEVRDPARVIPRAITGSFLIVLVIYLAVATAVMVGAGHVARFSAAPLLDLAGSVGTGSAALRILVSVAAFVAAFSVLLSLLAGIGRTLFAMAAKGDAPRALDRVSAGFKVPARAEIAAAVLAVSLVAVGRIPLALSISAVTILTYYSVAHLSALRLRADERRPWIGVPIGGLLGCVVLVIALLASV